MPMKSSKNLGTEQENKTELSMTSRRATPEATATPEVTPTDAVDAERESRDEAIVELAETLTGETDAYSELLGVSRERIDAIDEQLLELVIRRMQVAETLLAAKHERGINTRDKIRQEEIIVRLIAQATDLTSNGVTLNAYQIRELYELLIRLGVESFRQNIIDRR